MKNPKSWVIDILELSFLIHGAEFLKKICQTLIFKYENLNFRQKMSWVIWKLAEFFRKAELFGDLSFWPNGQKKSLMMRYSKLHARALKTRGNSILREIDGAHFFPVVPRVGFFPIILLYFFSSVLHKIQYSLLCVNILWSRAWFVIKQGKHKRSLQLLVVRDCATLLQW